MSQADTAPLSYAENLKQSGPTLAGSIAATIADPTVDRFSDDDVQFLKFHGVYQQDDRDLRKTGKKYMMMIRSRIPGGVMTAAQWLAFDEVSAKYGNNTMRITTRQTIQFHGVLKSGLGPLVKRINESLLSTLAACGDINRNVTASPTPAYSKAREEVYADSLRIAQALAPKTRAYHSIWIDNVQLNLEDPANKDFVDRFYKEGRAAAKLNDPNIVGAVDVGEANGYHYFVMEYVEGETVHDCATRRVEHQSQRLARKPAAPATQIGHGGLHGIGGDRVPEGVDHVFVVAGFFALGFSFTLGDIEFGGAYLSFELPQLERVFAGFMAFGVACLFDAQLGFFELKSLELCV